MDMVIQNSYTSACTQPEGYVLNAHDCNDDPELQGFAINPEAIEDCDEIDNNYRDLIDDEDPLLSQEYLWYEDADNDGEGNPNNERTCTQPEGWVDNKLDCDDSTPQVSSVTQEICDRVDNNCDGNIDEGVTQTFYADNDNDGYGDPNVELQLCALQEGATNDASDCNDASASAHPYAPEICDEIDNN